MRSFRQLTHPRRCRWEDCHRSPESFAVMPIGLRSPTLSLLSLLLSSYRTRVALLPLTDYHNRKTLIKDNHSIFLCFGPWKGKVWVEGLFETTAVFS